MGLSGSAARRHAWGRSSLGAVLLLWLTAALQPCAMALTSDDHGDHRCPHCPPAPAEHPAGHAGHSAMHNVPALGAASCAEVPGDCSPLDDELLDTRGSAPKPDQDWNDGEAWPASDSVVAVPASISHNLGGHLSQAPPGARGQPLYLLNCTFLQ